MLSRTNPPKGGFFILLLNMTKRSIYCNDTKETVTSYTKYLKTVHWHNLRVKKLLKNPHCEYKDCDSIDDLNIHHKTYKRLGHEKLSDLTTLCKKHHVKIHKELRQKRKLKRKSKRKPYLVGNKVLKLTPYRLYKLIKKNKLNNKYEKITKLKTN